MGTESQWRSTVYNFKANKMNKIAHCRFKIIQLHSVVVLSWRQRGKNILKFLSPAHTANMSKNTKSTHADWVGILISHRLSWNHRFCLWSNHGRHVWSRRSQSWNFQRGSGCCSTIFRKMSPPCLQGLRVSVTRLPHLGQTKFNDRCF